MLDKDGITAALREANKTEQEITELLDRCRPARVLVQRAGGGWGSRSRAHGKTEGKTEAPTSPQGHHPPPAPLPAAAVAADNRLRRGGGGELCLSPFSMHDGLVIGRARAHVCAA